MMPKHQEKTLQQNLPLDGRDENVITHRRNNSPPIIPLKRIEANSPTSTIQFSFFEESYDGIQGGSQNLPNVENTKTDEQEGSMQLISSITLQFDPLLKKDDEMNSKSPKKLSPKIDFMSKPESGLLNCSLGLSLDTTTETNENRMEDHLVTLGTKPRQSTGSRRSHLRRWKSVDSANKLRQGFLHKSGHSRQKSLESGTLEKTIAGKYASSENTLFSIQDVFGPSMEQSMTSSSNSIFNTNSVNVKSSATCTSFLTNHISEKLRSSEIDPSPHQVDLPTKKEVLSCARMCVLLEDYRIIDQNFDFLKLVGMSNQALSGFLATGTTPLSGALVNDHRPIVKKIFDCGKDLSVEGFFSAGNLVEADQRTEVAILKSDTERKIYLVWRGTTEQQTKPIKIKDHSIVVNKDRDYGSYSPFCKAYLGMGDESKLFRKLNDVLDENPFFDLVSTGYSFGAVLATICATRFASENPMVRVSCLTFACAKIGCDAWRQHVHSLSNLKVIRLENGTDPWVSLPSDLIHVGHTIYIPQRGVAQKKGKTIEILAYKFDKNSHQATKSVRSKLHLGQSKQSKKHSSVHTFVDVLTDFNVSFPTDFVGENVGSGVKGLADEQRKVV